MNKQKGIRINRLGYVNRKIIVQLSVLRRDWKQQNIWNFCVKLKTNREKFSMKLKQTKEWLYQNNDLPVKELIAKLNKKLVGHYRYYGVSHNMNKLSSFLHYVQWYLFKVLNRRSHKKSYLWNGYIDMLKVYPSAQPKIYVRLF